MSGGFSLPRFTGMAALLATLAGPVLAQQAPAAPSPDAEKVNGLLRARDYDQALKTVNDLLKAKPNDSELLFLLGVVRIERGEQDAAIEAFTQLTEKYPNLVEPYNNLAVVLAARQQLDRARAVLEKAVSINPGYAVAQENLADVYAELARRVGDSVRREEYLRLARKTYETVKLLEPKASGIDSKLAGIRAMQQAQSPAAASSVANVAATPRELSVTSRGQSGGAAGPDGEVLDAVRRWAAAWSNRDLKGYFFAYGDRFAPPQGMSREQWKSRRTDRIENKKDISVTVQTPRVEWNGDTATVRFEQIYRAGRLAERSPKTLVLEKQAGRWVIIKENSGA
ncbi:L,D-transpeptidase Cds6 family protein [Noviherbaspirillum humi]|nr:tetratricopeptide repeat protein [Noviherbaspirillum humi]